MQQYPLTFDDPDALGRYIAVLQLRIRRWLMDEWHRPDAKPLDERERKVYDINYGKITSLLKQKDADFQQMANTALKQAVDVMGERGLLDSWLIAPQIMGVTFTWFIVNALVSLVVFIITGNYTVLFFGAPAIHALGYLCCTPRLKRQRDKNLSILLGEAFFRITHCICM